MSRPPKAPAPPLDEVRADVARGAVRPVRADLAEYYGLGDRIARRLTRDCRAAGIVSPFHPSGPRMAPRRLSILESVDEARGKSAPDLSCVRGDPETIRLELTRLVCCGYLRREGRIYHLTDRSVRTLRRHYATEPE